MVRPARKGDRDQLVRMRRTLWPDSTEAEVDDLLEEREPNAFVLVAEGVPDGLAGFAELGSRRYAEGCVSSPVGYLEGIWVDPEARRCGIASSLVDGALAWARACGYAELGSDCDLENLASQAFHRATGFEEVQRIVCFRLPTGHDG